MAISTVQFISKTKLGEISRQRGVLKSKYQSILDEADNLVGLGRLNCLDQGLRGVSLGNSRPPIHRGLPNLQALLHGAAPSDAVVQLWCDRLTTEIRRGMLRADNVYLFGALLGEWDERDEAHDAWLAERHSAYEAAMNRMITAPSESPPLRILRETLSSLETQHVNVQRKINEQLQLSQEGKVSSYNGFGPVAENPYQPAELRAEAKRFLSDDVLMKQFSDAISVAARDPTSFSWGDSGVDTRAVWTRNKWRLYPEFSLIEVALLIAHSSFWSGAVEQRYTDLAERMNRIARYEKLKDMNAPEVIMQNEIRMQKLAMESIDLGWYESSDPWDERPVLKDDDKKFGIVGERAHKQAELRNAATRSAYYGNQAVNPMVRLVHAEIQTLRAAYPDQPLYVSKLDIKDYFPSVPHETLLCMLQGIGMTNEGIQFAEKFLSVPLNHRGEIFASKTGVLMDQPYSHWLCEWLLLLMEKHVHGKARTRIVRQLDDICLLSPTAEDALAAWQAVIEFVEDCGLRLNEAKCGAITLGGERIRQLPNLRPTWGLLELNEVGEWLVSEQAFADYLSGARNNVHAKNAVLAKVTTYNEHLQHLTYSVGLAMDLGKPHRESVNLALARFHDRFFDDATSISDGLRACIQERYGTQEADREMQIQLSESWMAWPITAGGLGLRLANILSGQYQIAFDERQAKRKPVPSKRVAEWQYDDSAWHEYYSDQLVDLEPAACRESKRMDQLVEQFIARGKKISGGQQEGLSEYWRWVLSIHGQSILDQFGTFEFLMTELLPLQLIQEKLMQRGDEDKSQ